jgi:sec-independent protein translocase protein TatC
MRRVKRRFLFVFLAFGIGAGLTWLYREPILLWLYIPAHGSLSSFEGLPIVTAPTEAFTVVIGLVMKGGIVAAFPVATFSVITLVSPLLDRKQRRFVLWVFTPALFLLFLSGAAFAYYVMLPTGMRYLLNFGANTTVPMIQLSEYMKLVTALIFWAGIVFELPLLMLLLAKLRIVGHSKLKKYRKYVPLAAFILGAVITPTFDMVNSTLVAVPLIVLFEVGLFLMWLVRPKPEGHRSLVQKAQALAIGVWRRTRRAVTAPVRVLRRKKERGR